jgi:ribosomal protein S18 acetylase RimI-like enzyme
LGAIDRGLQRGDSMTSYAPGAENSAETGYQPALSDAEILQKAIWESVLTSPEAFLKTVDDVDERSVDYWEKEINTSTWAVVQRGEEVVGIAVARFPDREMDTEIDPDTARFIESVWITPELRGRRIGERLVRFIFEVECKKNPEIKKFLLWVFDKNHRAIRLYERMGFVPTGVKNPNIRGGRTELQFQYQLTFDIALTNATETAVDEAARRADLCQFDVRYRILGENAS